VEDDGVEVILGGKAIPKVDKCKYLGSIIEKRRDIQMVFTIILGWGGKNRGMRLECYVIGKFL